jgi:hypothetical protein
MTPENVIMKCQQVCYRTTEFEMIIHGLEYIRNILEAAMFLKHEELDLGMVESFPVVTDNQDIGKVHWCHDIYESPRRKTRISYMMYNPNNPFGSTYIQFKLFTRNKAEDDFVRKAQVNYTLEEFKLFCNAAETINNELRKNKHIN